MLEQLKQLLGRQSEPEVLPRQEVADIIGRVFTDLGVTVLGPSYQVGPLGGEMEHLSLRLEKDGMYAWVSVNVYGNYDYTEPVTL